MKKILCLFILIYSFTFSQIVSFELVESWSTFDVQDIYTFGDIDQYVGEINYEVDGYRVSYLTSNENGDLVIASGAIFVPVDPVCSTPILSWQHGTVVADFGAPSENISNSALGVISASHGYVVVMSDYLGLGSGEGFHNYCHSDTEASSVISLILETNTFVNSLGFETNGQVFLMGYSQGGHATMAAVRELELNFSNELDVTASSPMAGPYSMSVAQAEMLNTIYPNPGYFPYIIFAYQNVYGNIYTDVSDVFKPGFDTLFEMYDGTYSMNDINEEIWNIADSLYGVDQSVFTPLDMINDTYYDNYQNNNQHPFRIALESNDLLDFIPESPMRLIHCEGDNDVPYLNSEMAYTAFSPFVDEELVLLSGGNFNHSECAQFAIISAKLFFDSLANLCDKSSYLNENINNHNIKLDINILGQPIHADSNNLIIRLYNNGHVEKIFLH